MRFRRDLGLGKFEVLGQGFGFGIGFSLPSHDPSKLPERSINEQLPKRGVYSSRVVMFGPRLFVVSSTIHWVEDSRYTAVEPGVDADQQLRAFLLVLFWHVIFSQATL